MNPIQASIEGTKEIGLAVLATTLSLVIVFLPVSFLSSVTGRLLFEFGVTATAAILLSSHRTGAEISAWFLPLDRARLPGLFAMDHEVSMGRTADGGRRDRTERSHVSASQTGLHSNQCG